MLLYGAPVVESLFAETKAWLDTHAPKDAFVAFFSTSDDPASALYLQKKQDYATKLGIQSAFFNEPKASLDEVLEHIDMANNNPSCLGIIVQLPLGKHLLQHQPEILSRVLPAKDIDGLGGILFGLHLIERVEFVPATPKAVFEILDRYKLGELKGKIVTVIGQSNLMGKPFALEAMRRGATVVSLNKDTPQDFLKANCLRSDYIVSATGTPHLLTPAFFDHQDLSNKVIIDVGYGMKDKKLLSDTDRAGLEALGAAITPVPGGVGPVTVACLFHNICSDKSF